MQSAPGRWSFLRRVYFCANPRRVYTCATPRRIYKFVILDEPTIVSKCKPAPLPHADGKTQAARRRCGGTFSLCIASRMPCLRMCSIPTSLHFVYMLQRIQRLCKARLRPIAKSMVMRTAACQAR